MDLSPKIDVHGPKYKVLAQVNQSDLAFLRERARAIDAEVWMEGSTLHAQPRTNRAHGALKMSYGKDLREFSVLADLAMQHTGVIVNGWDATSKSGLQHEATDLDHQRRVKWRLEWSEHPLVRTWATQGIAGTYNSPDRTGDPAIAEAYFKLSARRFVTGRGIAETTSQLRVGNTIDLDGLGPLFNGKYYVSEVKHLFDGAHGIRSEFTAERPGLGKP